MDRTGVGRRLYFETGDGLLEASWNPVGLNPEGTVELRGIDSNYSERLRIPPRKDLKTFEVVGPTLYVPSFGYSSGELFRAAANSSVDQHPGLP